MQYKDNVCKDKKLINNLWSIQIDGPTMMVKTAYLSTEERGWDVTNSSPSSPSVRGSNNVLTSMKSEKWIS